MFWHVNSAYRRMIVLHLCCCSLSVVLTVFQSDGELVSLFDGSILEDIDFSRGRCKLHECGLSATNAGEPFCLRPLSSDDFDKGACLY